MKKRWCACIAQEQLLLLWVRLDPFASQSKHRLSILPIALERKQWGNEFSSQSPAEWASAWTKPQSKRLKLQVLLNRVAMIENAVIIDVQHCRFRGWALSVAIQSEWLSTGKRVGCSVRATHCIHRCKKTVWIRKERYSPLLNSYSSRRTEYWRDCEMNKKLGEGEEETEGVGGLVMNGYLILSNNFQVDISIFLIHMGHMCCIAISRRAD